MISRLNPRRYYQKARRHFYKSKVSRLTRGYDVAGRKRIYLFHIRKTGGTSLAKMFLNCGGNDGDAVWSRLGQKPWEPAIHNGLIYIGWNDPLAEKGDFFFGFSHSSYDTLNLPADTFRMTCLRDPVSRVISHYRMLMDLSTKENPHPCFETEGPWLGDCFEDFVDRIPKQHLLNQLFMFSEQYSVDQASERLEGLDAVLFTESMAAGVENLREQTGLDLTMLHKRKSQHVVDLDPQTLQRLREKLQPEYELLEKISRRLGIQAA